MEFFNKASAIRLQSHLGKYLTADDDQTTVRQSWNGSSKKARWTVESVQGNPHVIRLKSCHGGYLMASDEAHLLGMTGKKVVQSDPGARKDGLLEWEPIKEGFRVKLRTRGGKFLRANGATPPWRNSITHDLPHRTATQEWIMWDVDVVDISMLENQYLISNASSFSSMNEDSSVTDSPSFLSESMRNKDSPSFQSEAMQNRWLSIVSDRPSQRSERGQGGMEFFDKAKAVRLEGHFGKYLVADDDGQSVRQSRNGSSHRARWTVEFVNGKCNTIRLKSCHGLYLTASSESFLLGMTGKKVVQTRTDNLTDVSIEWEPVKEGLHVKLMTKDGKFLRANGGTPPWKNSVTHDVPHRTATQDWILWGVDVLDITLEESDVDSDSLSPASSFNSLADNFLGSPDTGSPMGRGYRNSRKMSGFGSGDLLPSSPDTGSPIARGGGRSGKKSGLGEPDTQLSKVRYSKLSENTTTNQVSGMDFFKRANTVRLKSHHEKFLTADNDKESVVQDRSGTSKSCRWTVEFVEGIENVLRLKSCYDLYLTATDEEHLLGVTGRKVTQSMPRRLGSSIEWEPIRDGMEVKLKSRYGNFLRANGGLPPWRNSITHDIPHRHHDWVLWAVDVIESRSESPPKVMRAESFDGDLSSGSFHLSLPKKQPSGSFGSSAIKTEGRLIYFHVADDDGNVNDAIEGKSFQFKGHGLEDLVMKLEEETGLEDIIVCSRNRVNGKLYPLRLALPPNNATMNVVVIPSTSAAAEDFLPPAAPAAE